MKKVVVIGGGTGVFTVLTGLKNYPLHLSAIVTMADDGGSSGILREEFGILPPGDLRRALVALSSESQILADLFNYRFINGTGLKGHNFGNLFLTALERITGDFNQAVKEAGKILGIKGKVIPVTLDYTRLFARLENNFLVVGESNIDIPKHDGRLFIREVFLNPKPKANKEALEGIKEADLIIIGPGDLYTSIIPNFLVKGIKEAIQKSQAKKVYICNIMTKFGETNHFTAEDFFATIEKYLGKNVIDYFLVNIEKPKPSYLKQYKKEKAELVKYNRQLLSAWEKPKVIFARLLRKGPLLRHDPEKLGKTIITLLNC
ncbi:MAG: uridine diphosphate-N-acetylglucosamine-binding protein YvcK [Candidatus Pacebacteria bacterium]|nr:uridine diphosphate-N-acetylglucosamine-binding protein YvcK [Candidatus Paceibacterota bacterium]